MSRATSRAANRRLRALGAAFSLALPLACGTATGIAPPVAFPTAPRPPATESAPARPDLRIEDILRDALSLRGTPYRLGGETPADGLDCSGLVRYVLGQHRVDMPRTVAEQFSIGRRVKLGDVRAGDLLFFTTTAAGPTHVGIAVTSGRDAEFVHAPGAGGVVRVEHVDTPYWRSRVVGVRRVF